MSTTATIFNSLMPTPRTGSAEAFLSAPAEPVTQERIDGAIKTLWTSRIEQEYQQDKTTQLFRLREVDFYHRGIQDIQWNGQDWEARVRGEEEPDPPPNFNITRAYGRKYVPAMATRPWDNAIAVPESHDEDLDRRAADSANTTAQWLKRKWDTKQMMFELFFGFYVGGTQYAIIFMVPDEELFGYVEEPQFEERTVGMEPAHWLCQNCGEQFEQPLAQTCPACGVGVQPHWFIPEKPITEQVEIEPKRIPRRGPIVEIVDGSIFTHPFDVKDLKRTPWAVYEVNAHPGDLLLLYGKDLRDKMGDSVNVTKGDDASTADASYTRGAAAALLGAPQYDTSTRWIHRLVWLRPAMYELIADEEVRKELQTKYPEGLCAPFVGDHAMPIRGENIAARAVAIKPECGKFLAIEPYALSILEQHDLINRLMEMAMAFQERKLPTHIADASLGIADYLNKRRGLPTEVIETLGKYGRPISDGVQLLATPQGDAAQYASAADHIRGFVEFETSITPVIYGGMDRQPPTAEAARNLLNQAVQTLAVAGNAVSTGFAQIYKLAIRLMAFDSDKAMKIPAVGGGAEFMDLEALRNGRFDFEAQPGVPMSFTEKAQMLQEIIVQNPNVASALGLDKPINVGVVSQYLLPGMKELKIPMEEKRKRVLRTIDELMQAQPIPPMQEGEEPQPSIQPDPFLDDHQFIAETVVDWATSEEGMKAQKANPQGAYNVILWGKAQAAAVPPPPPVDEKGRPLPPGAQPAAGPQGPAA